VGAGQVFFWFVQLKKFLCVGFGFDPNQLGLGLNFNAPPLRNKCGRDLGRRKASGRKSMGCRGMSSSSSSKKEEQK